MTTTLRENPIEPEPDGRTGKAIGWAPVTVVCACLAAGWIASGSAALLAHPLKRMLIGLLLGVALLVRRPLSTQAGGYLALAVLVTLGMLSTSGAVMHVMAVALIAVCIAWTATDAHRNLYRAVAQALVVLALFCLACTSNPGVWLGADWLGHILGDLAGRVSGQTLNVGPTFAGLPGLVLMLAFAVGASRCLASRSGRALLFGVAATLLVHLAYLLVLSWVPVLIHAVAPSGAASRPDLSTFLRQIAPWYVPGLGILGQLLVAAAWVRWPAWRTGGRDRPRRLAHAPVLLLAMALPVLTCVFPAPQSLAGKKIVLYEKGFLNWQKPEHGQYGRLSSGMFGMLPTFLASLGVDAVTSPDLSVTDLQGAHAVVLLCPDQAWQAGQRERIWDYVRAGGTLLLMAEHTVMDRTGSNRLNEVLEPTALRVNFDAATFEVGGWLQSYQAMAHPVTRGIADDRNQFGVVMGASLTIKWPARPLLLGKWGWSDRGDLGNHRAQMGNRRHEPGERLGDLVLAAEQRLGRGRVLVLGDTSSLTNAINVGAHRFNTRLFAYLAGDTEAQPLWRQALGLVLTLGLAGLVLLCRDVGSSGLVVLGVTLSLGLCAALSRQAEPVLPDGRYSQPNNLAYIDASHLEAHSGEPWRADGVGGLALTLMRSGYLTLSLDRWSGRRIERAGLLFCIAPSRPYNVAERMAIRDFVSQGGTLIVTAGLDRARGSLSLLQEFGFSVGGSSESRGHGQALGHFKSPYLRNDTQRVYVRFHAAWPIGCTDPNAQVLAYGANRQPVAMVRSYQTGRVVVVGDTGFVMNQNLERQDGQTIEGLRENAEFWRWLLSRLRHEPTWIPPSLRDSGQEVTP